MHDHGVMHKTLNPKAIWIETKDGEFVSFKIARFCLGRATDLYGKAYMKEGRGALVCIS